jgi:hypothetical protein
MGSGGSHALWPVTQLFASRLFFKRFGQHEVHHPDYLVRVPAAVDTGPRVPELFEAIGDGDAGLEPAVPLLESVLAAYLDVGAAHPSGLRLLAAEDLDEERSLEEKSH